MRELKKKKKKKKNQIMKLNFFLYTTEKKL